MESGQTRVPRGLAFAQCTGLVQDALRSFTLEYKSHQWLWVPVRRAITFPDRGSNSTANSHAGCTLINPKKTGFEGRYSTFKSCFCQDLCELGNVLNLCLFFYL